MATKKLTNEFMEKILNDSAWTELSENFAWTEQMLEKHKNKVAFAGFYRELHTFYNPCFMFSL